MIARRKLALWGLIALVASFPLMWTVAVVSWETTPHREFHIRGELVADYRVRDFASGETYQIVLTSNQCGLPWFDSLVRGRTIEFDAVELGSRTSWEAHDPVGVRGDVTVVADEAAPRDASEARPAAAAPEKRR